MKSFSAITKAELYKNESAKRCCILAEYMGMLLFGSNISMCSVKFVTENKDVLNRFITLSHKIGVKALKIFEGKKASRFSAELDDQKEIKNLLLKLGLISIEDTDFRYRINFDLVSKVCCKKSFIKGAFCSGGTVIDPKKNYNLEFITPYMKLSENYHELLLSVGFEFKSVIRRSKYVLYLKNSDTISDFLSYMGAYQSQMELLNVKIENEIRNDFTRSVNIETANIEKTINASVNQVCAIERIKEKYGLESLPDELREVAELRLKHTDISLSELGKMLNPPLSKSGVNHRLKKIINMI